MTAPDRPVTEEEIREAAGAYAAQFCLKPTGFVAQDFTAGARFALAACASQLKSRLARYDEAVRLLNKAFAEFNDAEIAVFLAAEPKTEER